MKRIDGIYELSVEDKARLIMEHLYKDWVSAQASAFAKYFYAEPGAYLEELRITLPKIGKGYPLTDFSTEEPQTEGK